MNALRFRLFSEKWGIPWYAESASETNPFTTGFSETSVNYRHQHIDISQFIYSAIWFTGKFWFDALTGFINDATVSGNAFDVNQVQLLIFSV